MLVDIFFKKNLDNNAELITYSWEKCLSICIQKLLIPIKMLSRVSLIQNFEIQNFELEASAKYYMGKEVPFKA